MSLSIELKEYLQNNGATEVGFADITNFSPKELSETWKMHQH